MTSSADVIQALLAAVQQARHYGPTHPAARLAARQFHRALQAHSARHALDIEVGERALVVQSTTLPPEDSHGVQLRAHLAARRVHRLSIEMDAGEEAVATLVRFLALEPEELIAEGGLADALHGAGAQGIAVQSERARAPARRAAAETDAYAAAVRAAHDLAAGVDQGGPADVPRARLAVDGVIAAFGVSRQRLWQDVADRTHDELDPQHAVNTCLLTLFLGEALGLAGQLLTNLGSAALLHDIGLALLPWERRLQERTVNGPQAEWRHPIDGAFLLRHLGGLESLPMIVAAEHHLSALQETAVLPHSRLVSLADYVDALTCGRVPSMRRSSVGALLSELFAGGGPAFDPVHVRVLARLLAEASAAGIAFASRV